MQKYLISPKKIDDGFLKKLQTKLSNEEYFCFNLNLDSIDKTKTTELALEVKQICEANKTALIIANDLDLMQEVGASGIHLDQKMDDYENIFIQTRKNIGEDAILGISCFDSKDIAMCAGEESVQADYVMFSDLNNFDTKDKNILELITWWDEYTTLPVFATEEQLKAINEFDFILEQL